MRTQQHSTAPDSISVLIPLCQARHRSTEPSSYLPYLPLMFSQSCLHCIIPPSIPSGLEPFGLGMYLLLHPHTQMVLTKVLFIHLSYKYFAKVDYVPGAVLCIQWGIRKAGACSPSSEQTANKQTSKHDFPGSEH